MDRWVRLRRSGGMTQYELSVQAGVSRSRIADVETARATYTPAELDRIASVLLPAIAANLDEATALLAGTGKRRY